MDNLRVVKMLVITINLLVLGSPLYAQTRNYELLEWGDGTPLKINRAQKLEKWLPLLSVGAIRELLLVTKDSLSARKIKVVSGAITNHSGNRYAIAAFDNPSKTYFIVCDAETFKRLPLQEQMIIIGHEIGHCITNHLLIPKILSTDKKEQEIEADQISGYLNANLMTNFNVWPFYINALYPKATRIGIYDYNRKEEYKKGFKQFSRKDIFKLSNFKIITRTSQSVGPQ